ncbi:MAG: trypsin-like peptidase domain-containing protein [Deltaproteobacteria bacterium]|nr:trypsin-like peptidase domain-containing protein [Deltaproteobacteria bacterium]
MNKQKTTSAKKNGYQRRLLQPKARAGNARKWMPMASRLWMGSALLFFLTVTACTAQVQADSKPEPMPAYLSGEEILAAKVYRKALPAVVTIFTSQKQIRGGEEVSRGGIGSGVIISQKGLVLTAAHVIQAAEEIAVKTYEGEMLPAELLFSESAADLALIKIIDPPPGLKHAELGDSDLLVVGQMAYAIGSPYGLEHSFSAGHISGFRDFDRYYDGTIRASFIQTDAAINLGNSGGPILNSKGEVIGIASQILTLSGGFQGIGFVVPVNVAKQLLSLRERVWLGIEGIYLNREGVSKLLNQDLKGGLLVERVAKGSPADKAGLRGGSVPARLLDRDFLLGGDLIVEFGTREACSSDCLADAPSRFSGMDEIPVIFLRGGKYHKTTIDVSGSRRNFLEE